MTGSKCLWPGISDINYSISSRSWPLDGYILLGLGKKSSLESLRLLSGVPWEESKTSGCLILMVHEGLLHGGRRAFLNKLAGGPWATETDPLQIGPLASRREENYHMLSTCHLIILQNVSQQLSREKKWVSKKLLENRSLENARKYFASCTIYILFFLDAMIWFLFLRYTKHTHSCICSHWPEAYF